MPLLVVTDDLVVARRMRLLRGVRPIVVCAPDHDLGDDRDAFIAAAREVVESAGIESTAEACIFVHGSGRDATAPTDAIGVFRLGRGSGS